MSQTSQSNNALSDDAQRKSFPGESSHDETPLRHVRVAILGTGFAGLGMAIQLKRHGYNKVDPCVNTLR